MLVFKTTYHSLLLQKIIFQLVMIQIFIPTILCITQYNF